MEVPLIQILDHQRCVSSRFQQDFGVVRLRPGPTSVRGLVGRQAIIEIRLRLADWVIVMKAKGGWPRITASCGVENGHGSYSLQTVRISKMQTFIMHRQMAEVLASPRRLGLNQQCDWVCSECDVQLQVVGKTCCMRSVALLGLGWPAHQCLGRSPVR